MTDLAVPSEFDRRLAEVTTPPEAAQLARDMLALRTVAKTALHDRQKANFALIGYARAARKGGELLAMVPRSVYRGGPKKARSHAETSLQQALAEAALDDSTAHRWQQLATKVSDAAFAEWCELAEDWSAEPSLWEYFARLLRGQAVISSETNEWYTPATYIEAARRVLGAIDLDPASCDEANEVIQAERYFTADDDGLKQRWAGRVWLNPPYGRAAGDFIAKLVEEFDADHVRAAVALVNAHCTDTDWFQALWEHTLCFTDHRIDFAAGTADRSGSTHGSAFVYLGPEYGKFAREFAEFGAVVRRYS